MILKQRFSFLDLVFLTMGAFAFSDGRYIAAFCIWVFGGILSGWLESKFPPA
jgi:hypothetical protein